MTEPLNAPFEIWTSRQATQLLSEKHICILGDSIQRMVYKDLVKFLSTNKLCNTFELRKKAEPYFNREFHSDRLVDSSEAHNGTHYYEIREWICENGKIRVTFFFITRLYSQLLQTTILDYFKNHDLSPPDVWLLNSTVWDISRFGESSVQEYYTSLGLFFENCLAVGLKQKKHENNKSKESNKTKNPLMPTPNKSSLSETIIPKTPYILWRNALPIGDNARGGFLIPSQATDDQQTGFRLDIPGANKICLEKITSLKRDTPVEVLDVHNFATCYMNELQGDGIHWSPKFHRVLTMLTLTKIRRFFCHPRIASYFSSEFVGPKTDILRRNKNLRKLGKRDLMADRDRQGDYLWDEIRD